MELNNLKAIAVVILLILAGCGTQPTGSMESEKTRIDTTSTSSTLSPISTPKRPQKLTEKNVVQFVSKLEETRTHNRLLRDDVVDISVSCDASLRATSANRYYLETVCQGYADYENAHVDLGVTPTAYFVSDDEVRRINDSLTEIRSSDKLMSSNNSSNNFVPPYQAAEIRIYNFDSSQHDISVTVQYVGNSRDKNATADKYNIGEMRGLILDRITKKKGEYEVLIRLDSTRTERYSWNITDPSKTPIFSVYISPEGGVFISY